MLRITTEPTSEPITLTEAKDWLGIQGTAHDTKLTAAIKAARKKVEQLSGKSIAAKSYTLELDEYSQEYLDLSYPQVNAITTVKTKDSEGTETTIAATEYKLVYNRLYYQGSGYGLQVVYTTLANTEEFYKLKVKQQLAYDFRNEYQDKGFSQEVVDSLRTDTLNLGF